MDLSDIWAECGRLLADANNDRWSQAVLTSRANLATTAVLIYTNSVKTKETLSLTDSVATVDLDSSVIDVIRVDIQRTSGDWVPLKIYTRDQLDYEYPNWQQEANGEPRAAWWDGTNQQLNFVPAPDTANAITNGLRVWEIQQPTDLSASTDVPFDSNAAIVPYHMAIVHWVVAQCWMDDGTPEALSKSKFHRSDDYGRPGKFETEVKKVRQKFDIPEGIPTRILWRPEGGRANRKGILTKANPLQQ